MSSPKSDNKRLERCCLVWWISIFGAAFKILHKQHEGMAPSWFISALQAGGGVMGWELFCGLLSKYWASFKHQSQHGYCCWPFRSLYDCSVPIFWQPLQAGYGAMSQSSNQRKLFSDPVGMWWKKDSHHWCTAAANKSAATDARMSLWTKIQRNVFSILLNLCHDKLRKLLRHVYSEKRLVFLGRVQQCCLKAAFSYFLRLSTVKVA